MPTIKEMSRSNVLTEPVCIVDSHFGIYVPQVWAERYGSAAVASAGVNPEDVRVLLAGPDGEDYWDSWGEVLNDYCHEVAGIKHYITQDGDLFEYPETYQWEEF